MIAALFALAASATLTGAERCAVDPEQLQAAQEWLSEVRLAPEAGAENRSAPAGVPAPALFELLVRGGHEAHDAQALREALATTEANLLNALFEELIAEPLAPRNERAEALEVLTLAEPHRHLRLAPRLASPIEEQQHDPLLRDLLQALFERALDGDRSTPSVLTDVYEELDPELAVAVVRAGASRATGDSLAFLGGLLGRQPRVDALVLYHMQRLARSPAALTHDRREQLGRQLRGLLHDADSALAGSAASLAGRLADVQAVPQLIELLEHRGPAVRDKAHQALCAITQCSIAPDSQRWRMYYEAELVWYREGAPRALGALRSLRDEDVVRAVLELSAHRLFREELCEPLLDLLEFPQPSLRALGVAAVAKQGSVRAVPRLIEGLEDPSSEFRAACEQALVRITGWQQPSAAGLAGLAQDVWDADLWARAWAATQATDRP